MNTLIVYFSKFGNTKKIAEAMAEAMPGDTPARLRELEALTPAELDEADFVIVGSPTHYQNLPEAVRVKPKTFLVDRGQAPDGDRCDRLREGEIERARQWIASLRKES